MNISHLDNLIFVLLAHFLLRGVGIEPAAEGQTIPASAFMIFQTMFAAVTPGKMSHWLSATFEAN